MWVWCRGGPAAIEADVGVVTMRRGGGGGQRQRGGTGEGGGGGEDAGEWRRVRGRHAAWFYLS